MNRLKMLVLGVLMCLLLGAAPALCAEKLNINNATVEQLTALPGVGPVIAGKIVEYRTGHPFASVEEIKQVKGIGSAKYEKIKDLIMVDGSVAPASTTPSATPAKGAAAPKKK